MCCRKQSCLLLVGKVKSSRVGRPPPFLVPNGGLVRITSPCGSASPFGRERVAVADAGSRRVGLDAVQHQVHQREPVRVLHELHAVERVRAGTCLLRLGPARRGRLCSLDVAVGGDEEAAGAGRRVLDHVVERRLHQRHHESISGRGVKYWPAPDFFSLAFFSSRPS